jgi:hypothetical protein
MTQEQIREKIEKEYALRADWNKNITEMPSEMEGFQIMGQQYLVRLFKFENETVSEYGVHDIKYIEGTTDSGRSTARPDEFEFTSQAIVTHVSPQLTDPTYKVGDVVWINPSLVRPKNAFLHNRATPTVEWEGYLKVREEYIDGIVNK